jgi:hypothetical protein
MTGCACAQSGNASQFFERNVLNGMRGLKRGQGSIERDDFELSTVLTSVTGHLNRVDGFITTGHDHRVDGGLHFDPMRFATALAIVDIIEVIRTRRPERCSCSFERRMCYVEIEDLPNATRSLQPVARVQAVSQSLVATYLPVIAIPAQI